MTRRTLTSWALGFLGLAVVAETMRSDGLAVGDFRKVIQSAPPPEPPQTFRRAAFILHPGEHLFLSTDAWTTAGLVDAIDRAARELQIGGRLLFGETPRLLCKGSARVLTHDSVRLKSITLHPREHLVISTHWMDGVPLTRAIQLVFDRRAREFDAPEGLARVRLLCQTLSEDGLLRVEVKAALPPSI